MLNLLNNQLHGQIEGRIDVAVNFLSATKGKSPQSTEIKLYSQDEKHWVSHGIDYKRITREIYDTLTRQFSGEQEFNTDPEIINTELSYCEFLSKYGFNVEK